MKKKINRRDFLKVMGVVGMTASLAACGDSGARSAPVHAGCLPVLPLAAMTA